MLVSVHAAFMQGRRKDTHTSCTIETEAGSIDALTAEVSVFPLAAYRAVIVGANDIRYVHSEAR